MGDIADAILDGTLCEQCGSVVYEGNPNKASNDELSPGHTRKCKDCKRTNSKMELRCPECGSMKVGQYRSPHGEIWCLSCNFKVWHKEIDNPFVYLIEG